MESQKKYLIDTKGETSYFWEGDLLKIKNLYYRKRPSMVDFTFKNKRKVVAGEIIAKQHIEIDQGVGYYGGFNRYIYSPISGWAKIIESDGILVEIKPDFPIESVIKFKSPYLIVSALDWFVEIEEDVNENQAIGSIKRGKSKSNQEEYIVAPIKGKVAWLFEPNILNLNFGTLFSLNLEDKALLK
jgi:hypothetical protein